MSSHYRMQNYRTIVCKGMMAEHPVSWLADHATGTAPVFTEAEVPVEILRALDRKGLVIRVPGNIVILNSPGDSRDTVIQALVWSIVEKLALAYAPAVVERDSAVRLHLGRTDPGP